MDSSTGTVSVSASSVLSRLPHASAGSVPCPSARPRSLRFPSNAPRRRLQRLSCEFRSLEEPIDRVRRLLDYAGALPPLPEAARISGNRVAGCAAQVWVTAAMDGDGRMRFGADSDSEIARGLCGCLVGALDGAWPEEVMEVGVEDVEGVEVGGSRGRGRSRVNVWHNVLASFKERTEAAVAERTLAAVEELRIGGFVDPQAS